MLDCNFCIFLEDQLSRALSNSEEEKLFRFWCDGVLIDEPSPYRIYNDVSKKKVNDTRKVFGIVYMGEDGNGKYELTLHFGKYSLRRYAKGARLEDCVPDPEKDDWFLVDIENKKIEIHLK